jgi:polar amino acid transport system substrate-binding protein
VIDRFVYLTSIVILLLSVGMPGQAVHAEALVVGTKLAPPFVMKTVDDQGNEQWSGVSIELWEQIAQELDVQYEYEEMPLEALIDGVNDGHVDVAIAALTVTADREKRVDFSQPYFISSLGIAVPVSPAGGLFGMLSGLISEDFLRTVGLLILILLGVGTLIWIAERRINSEEFAGNPIAGIGSGFWFSAVTMTTVGYGDKSPRSIPGRILALIWMFTSLIVIAGITGAIASAFTVKSLQSSITSLDDVLSVRTATVKDSTSSVFLRDAGARPVQFASLDRALAALSANEVDAVVYDTPVLKYVIPENHAGVLAVLPLEFRREYYAIAVAENSPMLESINQELLSVVRRPQWQAVKRRYLGSE